MKIVITAKEAIDRGWFTKLAGETGLNAHSMSPNEEITITEEQLNRMGMFVIE